MYEILFSNKSRKFLKNCDTKLKARLQELFFILQTNPLPAKEFDLTKIGGETDTYRIRLSSHRVVYSVFKQENKIRILFIEKRKESTYKIFN